MLYIDVEQYSHIEETYGWEVFDSLLQHTARTLRRMIGTVFATEDFIAVNRTGGSDFYVFATLEGGEEAMDAKELAQELPGRVNAVLDVLAKNALRLKVDAFDEVALIEGLQKIANRIAMGVVLAALIVGAAIVMQIPTRWTVLGYPAVAMWYPFSSQNPARSSSKSSNPLAHFAPFQK